jgi:hypothetical protein
VHLYLCVLGYLLYVVTSACFFKIILGLQIDSNLNWKKHIQFIMPKLSSPCFAMRTVTSLMKT